MTIYEVLKFIGEPLERLTNAGIKTGDYKYIALYEDYRKALKQVKGGLYRGGSCGALRRERANRLRCCKAVRSGLQTLFSVILRKTLCEVHKRPNFAPTNGNKYYQILDKILRCGKKQSNKKGDIIYLLNEQLSLSPSDLLNIFEGHNIARKKLRSELSLFMQGERDLSKYREAGINWWDYCGQILINSYPTYFEKLPALIAQINREKRNSKIMCCSWARQVQKPIKHLV